MSVSRVHVANATIEAGRDLKFNFCIDSLAYSFETILTIYLKQMRIPFCQYTK